MRRNTLYYTLVFTAMVLLAVACGTSKNATSNDSTRSLDKNAVKEILKEKGKLNPDTLGSKESIKNELKDSLKRDTLAHKEKIPLKDSLASKDSLQQTSDSLALDSIPKELLDTTKGMLGGIPVFSEATDSIIEDFSGEHNIIYYYGDVSVKYKDLEIKSDFMAYDTKLKTVYASGIKDTITGKVNGKPEMTQGGKSYTMDDIYYNFSSGKSKIKNMITQQEEGYLHGQNLKMMPNKSINIKGGKYTVCDLDHPHFYLNMTAAKVVTQPTQKTVFGPSYLVLMDVPLPIGLPFGFVPKRPSRASGILFPTYGEETARGFYLKDLGYYFVFGDHFDLTATTDIYTLGSWAVKATSRYKVRYKYNGSFNMTYSKDQTGEKGAPDFLKSTNFALQWSHSQDAKARPGTSFRASVNFSSPSNNQYNSYNVQKSLQNQISSSISYSKTFTNSTLSINALHSQNSRDSSYAITFPNLTYTVNRFYPFKRKVSVGKEKFYEQISLSYNTSFQNKISFKSSEVGDPDFWTKMKNGMKHNFSIGLPSFTMLKYFNFSPSISYGMNWYFQDQSKYYNPETDEVETLTSDQFSTFGLSQTYSASMSMSTRLYGMFNFGEKLKIRHMITPSFSFSVRPEQGTAANGYRTYSYVDNDGVEHEVEYNKYSGGLNSPPSSGKSASMSFSFANNLEAKVADPADTTGLGTKKIKLIDQLNISGNYNFLADSMKLSRISVSANTSIFKKMSISGNMSFDPYAINSEGNRYNKLNIASEGGLRLARLTNASLSMNYSLQGKGQGNGNDGSKSVGRRSNLNQGGGVDGQGGDGRGQMNNSSSGIGDGGEAPLYTKIYYHPVTGEYIPGGWLYYLNPNIPWSLTMSYSYSFSKSYQFTNNELLTKKVNTQTLNLSGQIKLSPALNISARSGLDLSNMEITTTDLSATYDLHCFQISFSWVPTGRWQSWSFRINAKASALSDLLQYKKNNSMWDNY